jgi:hypothetical protein
MDQPVEGHLLSWKSVELGRRMLVPSRLFKREGAVVTDEIILPQDFHAAPSPRQKAKWLDNERVQSILSMLVSLVDGIWLKLVALQCGLSSSPSYVPILRLFWVLILLQPEKFILSFY